MSETTQNFLYTHLWLALKKKEWVINKYPLKGHSQLMHMRIKYHFLTDLHITRRAWNKAYPEYSKQTL